MNFKLCINCNNKFYQTPNKRGHVWRNAKFCNLKCWHIYKVKNGINYGFKKGVSIFEGRKHSQESIDKMKQSHKGQVAWNKGMKGLLLNRNFIDNNPIHWTINNPRLGKKHSDESKKKISLAKMGQNKGSANWKWITDRTKLVTYGDSEERRSPRYGAWRREVCNRDNWKCKISNQDCNGRLEVHHILSFTDFPELRYIINNGITLCHAHHPRNRKDEQKLAPIFQELVKG